MNYCKMTTNLLQDIIAFSSRIQFIRQRHTKHWNPKYKKERKAKVIKPDFSRILADQENISENDKRSRLKEKGIFLQKPWLEKPMYISCTETIFEPYVPPEGDGKFSSLSKIGAKQNLEFLMKKRKFYQAIKKIQKYEEDFNINEFADQFLSIYVDAHAALARKDLEKLRDVATEKIIPEMLYNLENKTVVWKFIQSMEPAKIVHARTTSFLTDNNMFAQITVRLHSQQVLAVYDRFGRLMYGSEILKKDVLEYIVLEKHLSNEYGQWRLHAKIVPPWMPSLQCINKTFVINQ